MRNRRAVIYDDDTLILGMMNEYLTQRGYEVMTFREPVVCPICENAADCTSLNACADVMFTDLMMPLMNGVELLKAQIQRGCKLPVKNKAIMSGYDIEQFYPQEIRDLDCTFFRKPFDFEEISLWLSVRELQMDLLQPLAIRRKEKRYDSVAEVTFAVSPNELNLKGTALNVSATGMCLKTASPLRKGQYLTVDLGQHDSFRTALVRWLREIEGGVYIVGLNLMLSLPSEYIADLP